MNTNYFLKQSTKKTLLLILVIPIIIQFILINIAKSIIDERLYYLTFIIFWSLYLPYFYWLNNAINFLHSHSNEHLRLKIINFKISLVINIIATFNFVLFAAYVFSFVFNVNKSGKPDTNIILCMALIQIVGVISFFYSNYFSCKLISTIELKRKVSFSEIVGNIISFSFPPITLWIINDKLKKIQANDQ